MKKLILLVFTCCLPLMLAGCYEDTYDDSDDYDYDSGGGSGGSGDALAGSKVTYTYTCPSGTQYSIDVTDGPCKSSQETYAYTFGCNQVNDMASACNSFYSCAVNNSSGEYADYYQQYLSACAAYGMGEPDMVLTMLRGE